METENLTQNILAQIATEHLAPKPRWMFVIRRLLWWIFAIITVLFGGIAFGSILYFVKEQEWDVLPALSQDFGAHLLSALPIVWIVLFVLLGTLTVLDLRASDKGYRYPWSRLIVGVSGCSLLVGAGLYVFGLDERADTILAQTTPLYREMVPAPQATWHQPASGRWSGVIIATTTDGFAIRDQEKNMWQVKTTTSTRWKLVRLPAVGERVKLIGTSVTSGKITLQEARPWQKESLKQDKKTKRGPKMKENEREPRNKEREPS